MIAANTWLPPIGAPFSRRVGAAYSLQVIINSFPLLLADFVVLTATLAGWKLLFIQLGINVGIDVTAAWLPIAAGFILLNFEMGLYPGVKLSPVEELRRLSVSVTCMFVVWSLGVYMLTGSLGDNKWLLLGVFYVTCLLTLPVSRSWTRRILGTYTNWGIPALVCGDDAAAIRVYQLAGRQSPSGLAAGGRDWRSTIARCRPGRQVVRRFVERDARRSPTKGGCFGPSWSRRRIARRRSRR